MPDFRTSPDGATLVLDEAEAALLKQLTTELRALLTGKRRRSNPVLDRLFPAAYEDAGDEKAYRELIGDDLLRQKLEALDTVSTVLDDGPTEVTLTGEDFGVWMACLTDLRLAIGTRLDVDEERMGADIDLADPDAPALTVLHWLGWVQDGLLRSLA